MITQKPTIYTATRFDMRSLSNNPDSIECFGVMWKTDGKQCSRHHDTRATAEAHLSELLAEWEAQA